MTKLDNKCNKQLLVEGDDDKSVISSIYKRNNIPVNFFMPDCNCIENVKKSIPLLLKGNVVNTLGIIIDADYDFRARWQSIQNLLREYGFNIPDDLPESGLINQNESKKVGVWIMPDNKTDGMLEDFLAFMVPEDDQLLPIARTTLENIETRGLDKYISAHKPKALIHTWLAWQKKTGASLGLSILTKYLSTDTEICTKFTCWLNDLFEDR